ncbi:MAG: hypothetical protein ACREON_09160 [Gemmatimonadaceae bacterium]
MRPPLWIVSLALAALACSETSTFPDNATSPLRGLRPSYQTSPSGGDFFVVRGATATATGGFVTGSGSRQLCGFVDKNFGEFDETGEPKPMVIEKMCDYELISDPGGGQTLNGGFIDVVGHANGITHHLGVVEADMKIEQRHFDLPAGGHADLFATAHSGCQFDRWVIDRDDGSQSVLYHVPHVIHESQSPNGEIYFALFQCTGGGGGSGGGDDDGDPCIICP